VCPNYVCDLLAAGAFHGAALRHAQTVILYLNPDWSLECGGELRLYLRPSATV
jgi:Rps23 Pro-64 3,4-dihydroxylase Tpa1-like proline 4-hydroxylase